jgi:hypothetical protein
VSDVATLRDAIHPGGTGTWLPIVGREKPPEVRGDVSTSDLIAGEYPGFWKTPAASRTRARSYSFSLPPNVVR